MSTEIEISLILTESGIFRQMLRTVATQIALITKLRLDALAGMRTETAVNEIRKMVIVLGIAPENRKNSKKRMKVIALSVGIDPTVM